MNPEGIARLRALCEAAWPSDDYRAPVVDYDPDEVDPAYWGALQANIDLAKVAREALPQLLNEVEVRQAHAASFLQEITDAIAALPEDVRIAAGGDLVRGIEGLEAAYQVERKAVADHAAEIARLREANEAMTRIMSQALAERDDAQRKCGGLCEQIERGAIWQAPEEWHYTMGDGPGSDVWSDACDTREEAIAAGREYHGPGVAFRVCSGMAPDPARYVPDPEDVIEWMSERAFTPGMPDPFDWPEVTDAAKFELTQALARWSRRHCAPTWWEATSGPEPIEQETT